MKSSSQFCPEKGTATQGQQRHLTDPNWKTLQCQKTRRTWERKILEMDSGPQKADQGFEILVAFSADIKKFYMDIRNPNRPPSLMP